MVKEFILICFIAFISWLILKKLIGKDSKKALYVSLIVICIGIVINIGYDIYRLFPETWLDTVGGDYRYGTFHGNMLAWSDKFMYGEEILIPMVRNRTVVLDKKASYCEKFFDLYGKDLDSIEVSETDRQETISQVLACQNLHKCEFEALALMGYTWPDDMPEDMINAFEDHKYPLVYIDMDSLEGCDRLKVVMDDESNLYMMGC